MTKYQFDLPTDFKEYLIFYKVIHKKRNVNDALIDIVREKIAADIKINLFIKKTEQSIEQNNATPEV